MSLHNTSLKCSAHKAESKFAQEWEADTDDLTNLCQKQVNYWNSQNPLSNDQAELVKKIAKLAILLRCKDAIDFVNALHKGMSYGMSLG